MQSILQTMKKYLYIILLAMLPQLMAVPAVEAKNFRNDRHLVWGKKPSKKNGLYTTKNFFISHGISLNVNAMYYFGDVDNEGVAFNGGFNTHNLSFGGGIIFAYTMPASTHCNLRYSLMGGTLSGNNELKFQSLREPRDDYRSFRSFMVQFPLIHGAAGFRRGDISVQQSRFLLVWRCCPDSQYYYGLSVLLLQARRA